MPKFPFYAFYDKPTTKAKLIRLHDDPGMEIKMGALDVGAEWRNELVEIINEYVIPGHPPGPRWVARTEMGSIIQDKPKAFAVINP